MDQRTSLRKFFYRKSRTTSRTSNLNHEDFSGAARPRTAAAVHVVSEQESRLFTKPKSSHSRTRSRRHTDAGARTPTRYVSAPSSRERHVELDRDTTSTSSRSRKRYSEDVADRNLGLVRPDGQIPTTGRSIDILDHNVPGYPRVVVEKSMYSEDVANRNMSISTLSVQSNASSSDFASFRIWEEHLASTQIHESDDHETDFNGRSVSPEDLVQRRKSLLEKIADQPGTTIMFVPPTEIDAFSDSYLESPVYPVSSLEEVGRGLTQRSRSPESPVSQDHDMKLERLSLGSAVSSLHLSDPQEVEVEPLNVIKSRDQAPPIPRRATKHTKNWFLSSNLATTTRDETSSPTEADTTSQVGASVAALADPTAQKSLQDAGIILSDSLDTHVHTNYAPAVTKELIKPTAHEIRQEQITREIHNHDVFHRILPIKQTEILPARHFYRNSAGEKVEIDAKDFLNESQAIISVEHVTDYGNTAFVPRQFTASTLEGFAQDYEERVDADGACRSHTTWIHPPVLQDGGRETGQTTPFHFGGDHTGMSEPSTVSKIPVWNEWHDTWD